jgi:hypothetical protein
MLIFTVMKTTILVLLHNCVKISKPERGGYSKAEPETTFPKTKRHPQRLGTMFEKGLKNYRSKMFEHVFEIWFHDK